MWRLLLCWGSETKKIHLRLEMGVRAREKRQGGEKGRDYLSNSCSGKKFSDWLTVNVILTRSGEKLQKFHTKVVLIPVAGTVDFWAPANSVRFGLSARTLQTKVCLFVSILSCNCSFQNSCVWLVVCRFLSWRMGIVWRGLLSLCDRTNDLGSCTHKLSTAEQLVSCGY